MTRARVMFGVLAFGAVPLVIPAAARVVHAPQPAAEQSAAVYDLVLRGTFHAVPGRRMVVKNSAIAMRPLAGSNEDWMKQFANMPHELRRAAARRHPARRAPFTTAELPKGTRLVDAAAVKSLFVSADGEPSPDAAARSISGWLALSEVIYTVDGRDALVYYEARCGGLCGEGGYVWARRAADTDQWRLGRKVISWLS